MALPRFFRLLPRSWNSSGVWVIPQGSVTRSAESRRRWHRHNNCPGGAKAIGHGWSEAEPVDPNAPTSRSAPEGRRKTNRKVVLFANRTPQRDPTSIRNPFAREVGERWVPPASRRLYPGGRTPEKTGRFAAIIPAPEIHGPPSEPPVVLVEWCHTMRQSLQRIDSFRTPSASSSASVWQISRLTF
jgi:hypothetical protein